jgi:predicted metal-dependent hydrolase
MESVQNVTIIRSRRKSIAIEIQRDGKVLIRAPLRASQSRIDALLIEKNAWIAEKLALSRQMQAQIPNHAFDPGETFPYLGVWYPLKLVDHHRPALSLGVGFELARTAQSRAHEIFTAWYRREAARLFQERISYWSAETGLHPGGFGLSSARTRWGSCGPTGKINLTWRLVMAPLPVVDYVVVHEITHLKVKNHSKNFWNLLSTFLPDYLQRRKWLNDNGLRLDL